jgi:hypothetical protein
MADSVFYLLSSIFSVQTRCEGGNVPALLYLVCPKSRPKARHDCTYTLDTPKAPLLASAKTYGSNLYERDARRMNNVCFAQVRRPVLIAPAGGQRVRGTSAPVSGGHL